MANDVEHIFMCLFAVHMSSLVKCLTESFAYFLMKRLSYYYYIERVLYTGMGNSRFTVIKQISNIQINK